MAMAEAPADVASGDAVEGSPAALAYKMMLILTSLQPVTVGSACNGREHTYIPLIIHLHLFAHTYKDLQMHIHMFTDINTHMYIVKGLAVLWWKRKKMRLLRSSQQTEAPGL